MKDSLKQFRDPELSLWQSAADQVVARQNGALRALDMGEDIASATRPDDLSESDPLIRGAIAGSEVFERLGLPTASPTSDARTFGVVDAAAYCSATALKLAWAKFTGNKADVERYREQLGQFTDCDPRWLECVEEYLGFLKEAGTIPYRTPDYPGYPFVVDGRLPDNAKLALMADWGTGQDGARKLLEKLEARDPDVVIHLGDIYYSGTEHEVRNYFYAIWQDVLGIPWVEWGDRLPDLAARPATFTLSGNHDMYSGGKPYYTLIDMLGQPASYFCLRNEHWQFVALDTGLNDVNPVLHTATSLRETEVGWLKERIDQADGRKTVLLSHHQLFSAYERIAGRTVNEALFAQVRDVLPQVAAWFWGHEHNLVVYESFAEGGDVLGRCIGHGAFPVGVDEPVPDAPAVPVEDVKLAADQTGGLFQHGYVMLELEGPTAEATYYQYDADSNQETPLYSEAL